jgi:hypothetical protein
MNRWTIVMIAFGAAALAGTGWVAWRATGESREWRCLSSWSGKPLTGLSDETRAEIHRLLDGHVRLRDSASRGVWRLLALEGPGGVRKVVVIADGRVSKVMRHYETTCDLVVEQLEGADREIVQNRISGGWETDPREARAEPDRGLGPWVFSLELGPEAAPLTHRLYVALTPRGPVLVRVEDPNGNLLQNYYEPRIATVGPPLPDRSPAEWERSLESADPVELLETLVWLGGRHREADLQTAGPLSEPAEAVLNFRATRQLPGVRAKVAELTKHPHPWVVEAARSVK